MHYSEDDINFGSSFEEFSPVFGGRRLLWNLRKFSTVSNVVQSSVNIRKKGNPKPWLERKPDAAKPKPWLPSPAKSLNSELWLDRRVGGVSGKTRSESNI
jgi:hypothetical protein